MKKTIIGWSFLVICLAMCLSLSLGILFAGPSQAGANEQLSQFPPLLAEDGSVNLQFPQQLSDWFRDRFFLRQELISVDHWLDANIFRTSGDAGVVLGTDGWLYYADTLADYTGTNPMTQRELFAAANNLSLMSRYCQENGRQFAFVIAPNKNSVYGSYMPNYGVQADTSNAQQLMELLQANRVTTVDLFSALEQEEQVLYFAHDSHWNTLGAALGADLINAAFGIESDYYGGDFSQTQPHSGDLFAMLYPGFTDSERDFLYGGSLDYSFTTGATRPDSIVLNTQSSASGSLLAYRDSFGNLLFPFLADSYGTCRFARSPSYDLTKESDYVLIELVERNLRYLIQNLPVMPALPEQVSIPETVRGTVQATASQKGDLLQLKGALPAVDDQSPIYIISNGTAYQAFCLEQTGFGIHLPQQVQPQYAMCQVDGTYVLYEIEIQQQ